MTLYILMDSIQKSDDLQYDMLVPWADAHCFLEDRLVARRFSRQFDRNFFDKYDLYWGWTLAYLLGCSSFP